MEQNDTIDEIKSAIEPVFVTFVDLANALAALHLWNAGWVARLHDVWLLGAPSPNSIIKNPKGYDPRKKQEGNFEARLMLPTKVAEWIVDCSTARGMPLTMKQAINMVYGEADYNA